MKRLILISTILVASSAILFNVSCKKEPANTTDTGPVKTDTEYTLTPYQLTYNLRFPAPVVPGDNQPYVERIQLGRQLYYDPQLSNDGRSCSGCHNQALGFTTKTMVNSMPVLPHVNMAWYTNFMWDGSKSGTLEELMLFETKDFFQTDLNKINAINSYKSQFKKYYKVDNITHKDIAYALAQFVRTLISKSSKYDKYINGLAPLTADEEAGRDIYFSEKGDCFHCHSALTTTDNVFHNTGLDSNYSNPVDKGYYNVTQNPIDVGKFRTPNLRNVALRQHYMHDGRFSSLLEVINFYDHGVKHNGNLDPIMTKAGKENGLKLTELQKQQLITFLQTFTDSVFITDPSFKSPY